MTGEKEERIKTVKTQGNTVDLRYKAIRKDNGIIELTVVAKYPYARNQPDLYPFGDTIRIDTTAFGDLAISSDSMPHGHERYEDNMKNFTKDLRELLSGKKDYNKK